MIKFKFIRHMRQKYKKYAIQNIQYANKKNM